MTCILAEKSVVVAVALVEIGIITVLILGSKQQAWNTGRCNQSSKQGTL